LDRDAFVDVRSGETIEVVMGAELDDAGQPRVYRHDPRTPIIIPSSLPRYLTAVSPTEVKQRIELRRWRGTSVDEQELNRAAPDDPIFVLVPIEQAPSPDQWHRFRRQSDAYAAGVVSFKPRDDLWSLLAPNHTLPTLRDAMQTELGVTPDAIHCFALSALEPTPSRN
jgi:hypothetical protein